MTKKILAVLLALAMMFSICSVMAFAEIEMVEKVSVTKSLNSNWANVFDLGNAEDKATMDEIFEALETPGSVMYVDISIDEVGWGVNVFASQIVSPYGNIGIDKSEVTTGVAEGHKKFKILGSAFVGAVEDEGYDRDSTTLLVQVGTDVTEPFDCEVTVETPKNAITVPEGSPLSLSANAYGPGFISEMGIVVDSYSHWSSTFNDLLKTVDTIKATFTVTGVTDADYNAVDFSEITIMALAQAGSFYKVTGEGVTITDNKDGTYDVTVDFGKFADFISDASADDMAAGSHAGVQVTSAGEYTLYYKNLKWAVTAPEKEDEPAAETEVYKVETLNKEELTGNIWGDGCAVDYKNGKAAFYEAVEKAAASTDGTGYIKIVLDGEFVNVKTQATYKKADGSDAYAGYADINPAKTDGNAYYISCADFIKAFTASVQAEIDAGNAVPETKLDSSSFNGMFINATGTLESISVVVVGGKADEPDEPSEDDPSEDEPEVPSDAKIPSGYKAIKTITGGKVTFPEDEYNKGSANGTLVTLVQSEYNLTEDDYIYFSITPSANLTKYKVAGQVQNTSWGSDWQGVTGGDNVNSVGFYLKDVLAINPSVPLAQLQQVLLQVWDGEIGDSVEDYTVVIARKSEEPIKPGDATVEEVVYSMEHTDGQYFENKPLKGGLKLEKDDSSDQMCRIATNWVNGGTVYNAIINALKSSNGNLKITYTGDFEGLSLQYASGDDSAEMIDIETDKFTITEVDGKKVASIPAADVVKAFADGIAATGWRNLIMVYGDEMTLYAFEVTNIKSGNIPAVIPDNYKEVPVTLTKTTEDGKTVLTPDSELMVDELVIPFKNVAPEDGKVTVYYGVPSTTYYLVEGDVEFELASDANNIQFKTQGWDSATGKASVISVDLIGADGSKTPLEIKNDGFMDVGTGTIFNYASLPETVEAGSKIKLHVKGAITDTGIVYRCYPVMNTVDVGCAVDNYVKVFSGNEIASKPTVPESNFETYTANFKAGDSYVVVKVNGKKAITKIEIEPETVEVTGKVMVPADEDNTPFGYAIQTGNNKYHGFRIGPFMISMPHRFVNGICPICHQRAPKTTDVSSLIEADEDEAETVSEPAPKKPTYEASEDALYVLETTGGQNFEDVTIAGGADLVTSDGRTRLATSWVGGGTVYNDLIKALQDNEDAVIKITYTGTITAFGIESENAGIIDVECEVTEGDEFNTMTCNVADFLEAAKKAIEDTSWRNVYLVAEDGAVLYGFEIVAAE